MRKVIAALVLSLLFASPSLADSLGSAVGGQAAPQSNMSGGLCLTSPVPLTNGQQAGVAIDCNTHAVIVTGAGGGGLAGIRSILTGGSDFATVADFPALGGQAIFWNSSATVPKTEHLPACNAGLSAGVGTIVDERATANIYPITLRPNGSDTINLAASYPMNFKQQSTTIQCNGAGNWVVE